MALILQLASDFNDEHHDVPLNIAKVINMTSWAIEDGVTFVSKSGFIGGVVVEDIIRDWSVLQEMAWYASDKSGIKLLNAFIDAGLDLGVDEIRVCTLDTSSPIVGRILQRKGFAPLETSYRLKTGA